MESYYYRLLLNSASVTALLQPVVSTFWTVKSNISPEVSGSLLRIAGKKLQ